MGPAAESAAMDRPPLLPQHPHPGSRAPQVVLAVFVAVLAAMLGLRASGNRLGARPPRPARGGRPAEFGVSVLRGVVAARRGLRAYGNRLGARPTDHVRAVGAPVDLNT